MLNRACIKNHSSANDLRETIAYFIETELDFGALLGPFEKPPHENFHCSPLMTGLKDVNKRRIIVDLSHGDTAVNSCTNREVY